MKSLKEIALQIDEPTYRKMPELSYSMISRFQSVGFDIDKLQERISSPSLTYGQAVDAIITGGQEEFDRNFMVVDLPNIPESASNCVRIIWNKYKDTYKHLKDIPMDILNIELKLNGFWPNSRYSAQARINGFFKNPVEDYYQLNYIAENKSIINTELHTQILQAVNALKTSIATKDYFADDNPWDNSIEKLYQLKFRADLNGVGYKCMMDECIVLHDKKLIIPIDLKTSCSCEEKDFYFNFLQWHYQLQARLYTRILRANLDQDDYFKDFKILNYRFIFCNKDSCSPLVWEFAETHSKGTLYFGRHKQIGQPDPEDLGKELFLFFSSGQKIEEPLIANRNSLDDWINTL